MTGRVLLRDPDTRGWVLLEDPSEILVVREAGTLMQTLARAEAWGRDGGWAAGFVTYEAAAAFDLPVANAAHDSLPLAWFALFAPARARRLDRLPVVLAAPVPDWSPAVDAGTHASRIAAVKERIAAGDTYQINLTFQLTAPFDGDPLGLFASSWHIQRGEYAAFVDTGRFAVCSASPELFFERRGRELTCRPMKGTAARAPSADADREAGRALAASAKDRAENVMIVDMVRNDLGRIADIGSVRVARLFEVERYPRLWQLTSTVRATSGASLADTFAALFPSGSVTGAPKRSSMAIIRSIEEGPRGVYTGAVGAVLPGGDARFNIAIRTITVDRGRRLATFGTGSGVVWDSRADGEYAECVLKATMLHDPGPSFSLLETLRWAPDRGYWLLDRHLDRLAASADYFDRPFDRRAVLAALDAAVAGAASPLRVRLLVDPCGDSRLEKQPLDTAAARTWRVSLAREPVNRRDVFLFHKTTRREVYDGARAARAGADDVLLWNEDGDVTESTLANIVIERDGRRVTPPVAAGLLAGTFRAELLAAGVIQEERIACEDVIRAKRVWLINSVRGWIPAELEE